MATSYDVIIVFPEIYDEVKDEKIKAKVLHIATEGDLKHRVKEHVNDEEKAFMKMACEAGS